ncbi:MAG: hypothetical protein COC12_07000 [Rhodobacteraceae bacterium]|nr:MAG: hypothetical protein COC12_07000 [Paracoccaceae bacterium]
MFNIAETPEFTHTVHVLTPVDGGHREDTFKARFKVVDDEENKADFYKVGEVKDYLRGLLVGMEDLVDEQKNPVPYSDSVRDQMLALPHVRLALLKTYNQALAKARVGN